MSTADHGLVVSQAYGDASGPITYLVMEDQFPSVAAPREPVQSTGISSSLYMHECVLQPWRARGVVHGKEKVYGSIP